MPGERSTALVRQPDPLPDDLVEDIETATQALVAVWMRGAESIRPKVSASQLRALIVVDRHSSINLMGLADELGSIPSVTSRLCDRLQAAGLLVRRTSEGDRREVVLQLSKDGRRLLRQLHRERQSDLAVVLQAMSSRNRNALLAGLNAFYTAAEATLPEEKLA